MPIDDELQSIIDKAKKSYELATQDPAFSNAVKKVVEENQIVQCTVDEVRKAIFNRPSPPDQATFSFIPTEMTRLSPFFPLSDKAKREYQELTWENSWGRMSIKGVKLSIQDEDILLALVRLFQKRQALTLTVSRKDICDSIGKGRGKNTNVAMDKAIERLTGTLVTIEVWDNIKTKNPMIKMGNTILTGYSITGTGKITVTLNPYFKEAYLETMVTSIDVNFRMSLTRPISKSLHRFLESQGKDYQIHIDKLVVAININTNQERKHIRAIIKTGLKELQEKEYLEFFDLSRDDIVTIRKKGSDAKTLTYKNKNT